MFTLTIRTPSDEIFKGEVESVSFDATDGAMQIFEHHASVTASIDFTPLIIDTEGKTETFLARNGTFYFENDKNRGTFLLLHCEKSSELDFDLVKDYANFIEQRLQNGENLSDFQLRFLEGERFAIEKQGENTRPPQ